MSPLSEPVFESGTEFGELERCQRLNDLAGARVAMDSLATKIAADPIAIQRASLILERLGALEVAEELVAAAVDRHPTNIWVTVRHATIAGMRRDYGLAITRWKQVVRNWPDDPVGLLGLAELRLSRGQHSSAVRLYKIARSRFPENPWAADGLAAVHTARHEWHEAAQTWARVQEQYPQHERAKEQLAIALQNLRCATVRRSAEVAQQQGNLLESITHWQLLVDTYPSDVSTHLNLAFLNKVLGRTRRSVETLKIAVKQFPEHLSIRLELLLAARADGDIGLEIEAASWLAECADEAARNAAFQHIRRLLDITPTFAEFKKVVLLALAEPDGQVGPAVEDFIRQTIPVWRDRRVWLERVYQDLASHSGNRAQLLIRLDSSKVLLRGTLAMQPHVPRCNDRSARSCPVTNPIPDGALEEARLRAVAMFAYLNVFLEDRRLRRYQADILKTGAISFGELYAVTPAFAGCLYYSPPKSFAYRYVSSEGCFWLIVGLAARGFAIIGIYEEQLSTLFYDDSDPTIDLDGFLRRQLNDINEVVANHEPCGISEPKAILVSGFANYAHYMWNELSCLLDVECWQSTKIHEISVVYEPFGSFHQVVRWPDATPVRLTSDAELGANGHFHEVLLFTPGSTLVTAAVQERLRDVCAKEVHLSSFREREAFCLWISLRRMYRHATNMLELMSILLQRIEAGRLNIDIALDGFSLPSDILVANRYDYKYYQHHQEMVQKEAMSFVAKFGPVCNYTRFFDLTGLGLPAAIEFSAYADFYLCHHGTQQHKIGWMRDIPGLIHANVAISSTQPQGNWAQAQCDSPVLPEYIPARFIGDAVTDNERQEYPDFRDYKFVMVEECAKFVFERVEAAYKDKMQSH